MILGIMDIFFEKIIGDFWSTPQKRNNQFLEYNSLMPRQFSRNIRSYNLSATHFLKACIHACVLLLPSSPHASYFVRQVGIDNSTMLLIM